MKPILKTITTIAALITIYVLADYLANKEITRRNQQSEQFRKELQKQP